MSEVKEMAVMDICNLDKITKDEMALIIIDQQNEFYYAEDDDTTILCPGVQEMTPNIIKVKQWCKKNGIPVFYSQEVHRAQKCDFGQETMRSEPEHALEGTPGIEIIEPLKPEPDDIVVIKRRYSSFYQTDLEIDLRGLDKKALIVTGAATNVCVYATVLDAFQRDMKVVVLSDCVAPTAVEFQQPFLRNIYYLLGDVVTSDEFIEYYDNH